MEQEKKWNISNLDEEVIKEKYKQESERLIDATDHGEREERSIKQNGREKNMEKK